MRELVMMALVMMALVMMAREKRGPSPQGLSGKKIIKKIVGKVTTNAMLMQVKRFKKNKMI